MGLHAWLLRSVETLLRGQFFTASMRWVKRPSPEGASQVGSKIIGFLSRKKGILSRRMSLLCSFPWTVLNILILKKYLINLFLERGEGKEKERERNVNVWLSLTFPLLGTWPTTQACALTGNQTGDPLVHRLVLNPLSHTSQG